MYSGNLLLSCASCEFVGFILLYPLSPFCFQRFVQTKLYDEQSWAMNYFALQGLILPLITPFFVLLSLTYCARSSTLAHTMCSVLIDAMFFFILMFAMNICKQ